MISMKTTTASRFSTGTTTNDSVEAVLISADTKQAAQAAIKLVQAWVKANGGGSKLMSFTSAPRWSSNLDLVFRARVVYRVAGVAKAA